MSKDPTTQRIIGGAVVELTEAVADLGIVLIHPDMPPFKVFVVLEKKDGNTDVSARFEKIEKESPLVQNFEIDIAVAQKESSILMPPEPKLVLPEDKH